LSAVDEPYLAPYQRAAERHGAGFETLLWASPQTQQIRFEAIRKIFNPAGKFVLDAGCGRADYLEYLLKAAVAPARYIGIEGVEALALAAEEKKLPRARIFRGDFVRHPARMFVGADIIVFSGSLNTLDDAAFYETLRHAYQAAGEALVFNFLASWNLAGRDYLHWRRKQDVRRFVEDFSASFTMADDYLDGDCTVCVLKD
jgi:SAM-dependent methyltransferase